MKTKNIAQYLCPPGGQSHCDATYESTNTIFPAQPKDLAEEIGIPYQTLINLYLRDCAATSRRLSMEWKREN